MTKAQEAGSEAGSSSAARVVPDRYTTFELREAKSGAVRICRVLQYHADGMHHAHELNTDLVGYADSPEEAVACLRTIITEQIAHLKAQGEEGLLECPAPAELQTRAMQAQHDSVSAHGHNPHRVLPSSG